MVNLYAQAVLLLNGSWEPIRILSIKRAVALLLSGSAEPVDGRNLRDLFIGKVSDAHETSAAALRTGTAGVIFEIPNIIKLKYYTNVPKRGIRWTRRNVLKRDDYTCVYCGRTINEYHSVANTVVRPEDMTIDHVIPSSNGGRSTWTNTVCACRWCNNRKGDRTPNEAGMRLLREPKRPRTNYFVLGSNFPEEWKIYLEA